MILQKLVRDGLKKKKKKLRFRFRSCTRLKLESRKILGLCAFNFGFMYLKHPSYILYVVYMVVHVQIIPLWLQVLDEKC